MKRVSLKDIAEKVGVSTALVSYVLNNKKEGRISKAIALKIKDTAKQMNYRTNQIAKSLKTNKTFTIGLIVADISNPFASSIARIIEDAADRHLYTVLFGSSDEKVSKFAKLVDTFLNRQVDGLIISAPDGAEEQIQYLQTHGIPFVLLDRYFPKIPSNYVVLDNYTASFEATEHLIQKGRRRIGLITYKTGLFHLKQRKKGYQNALKKNGIEIDREWVRELSIEQLEKAVPAAIDFLLQKNPPIDGLLFGSNTLSAIGLRHLTQLSVLVPDDLSIVSFDETEALDLFYAPLTYLKQPLTEMGRKAVDILLAAMENNQQITQLNLKANLIVRRST